MNKDTLEEYIDKTPSAFHGTSISQQLVRLKVSVGFYCEVMDLWLRNQILIKRQQKTWEDLGESITALGFLYEEFKGLL